MAYGEWRPYVSVAQRRAMANREMKKLRKQSQDINPVEIQGRKIASTFWGESWCTHLEGFSDFANRLPRGRTYVRNGSVCHLAIKKGKVEAIVSGSELYNVVIDIAPLPSARWEKVRKQCTGQIGSMLELLQGQLSSQVMAIVTDPGTGLFPQPKDIEFHCDCPDWAYMCKHVAAVLYGVGARLDEKPELLFVLRKVDHEELISTDMDLEVATTGAGKRRRLANQDLSNIFGIDIDDTRGPATAHRPDKENSARKTTAQGAKDFTPTGVAISRLRKRFGMTRTQFADLIGVTPQTIASWENRRGKLKLQQRTRVALTDVWHSSTI